MAGVRINGKRVQKSIAIDRAGKDEECRCSWRKPAAIQPPVPQRPDPRCPQRWRMASGHEPVLGGRGAANHSQNNAKSRPAIPKPTSTP